MKTQSNNIRTFFPEAFYLGFVLIGSQIILIREFLMIFNGNELVIGLLFAIWMLLTAVGAWLGRKVKPGKFLFAIIRLLLVIVAVYPIIAAFGMEFYRNDFFETGRMISPVEMILYSSLLLTPHCLAGGLAFNLINISSSSERGTLQTCYAYESVGSLSGGILVSVIFIYYLELDNLKSLQYLALASMIFFGITEFRLRKFFQSFVYLLAAIGFMHLIYNYDLNIIAKKALFSNQEVILAKETPYGNFVVTKTNNQINFYENGILSFITDDAVFREECIHYALLQRPTVKSVLLIGGSVSGIVSEALKYPDVEKIDLLEANPELFELESRIIKPYPDPRVSRIVMDPVIYVNSTDQKYDAIIINQPSPSNMQISRYYTLEFYSKLKSLLKSPGIISTSLNASSNYLSEEEVEIHSTIYKTLAKIFKHVLIVPGNKNYFLASDEELTMNYKRLLEGFDPENKYVNDSYLSEDLLQFRSSKIIEVLQPDIPANRDFKPVAYQVFIRFWLSHYGISIWIILGACLALSLILMVVSKPAITAMFTSGFTGAAAEVALIIAFQVIFGYAYLFIGVIITAFMAGLAIGAYFSKQCKMKNWYKMLIFIQLFSGIYLIVIALKLTILKEYNGILLIQSLFVLMTFTVSLLVGLQYGVSVCKSRESVGITISQIYSADLIGAAMGSLLVAIWLIPVFGLLTTMIILGSLHFLTILLVEIKRKMKYF